MPIPQLWLFAGPNGAGKTTFTRSPRWSGHIRHFLNADDLTRSLIAAQGFASYAETPLAVLQGANLEAAERVFSEVHRLLMAGESVAVETVLSTDKYLPLAEQLRREGGLLNLIYVGLRSPELSIERVARRVAQGGHPVPREKLTPRWHRSLERLPRFARLAHHFYVYDNSDSDSDRPPALVAHGGDPPGVLQIECGEANPMIVSTLLGSRLFDQVTHS